MDWESYLAAARAERKVRDMRLSHLITPDTLALCRAFQAQSGAPALLVGGCVRDALLGVASKDVDIEVYGLPPASIARIARGFGKVDMVGVSFGVVKLTLKNGEQIDLSVPRRESRTGAGHTDFAVDFDPDITPREAAARRDFTINAMMYDPLKEELYDFFKGYAALESRVLLAPSAAFAEDPLRVLRGMQFAGRFRMRLFLGLAHNPDETAAMAKAMAAEYPSLARERISEEWMKLATRGIAPGSAMRYLIDAGWLSLYPQLAAIEGVPQDHEWHPEGWQLRVLTKNPLSSTLLLTSMTQADAANNSCPLWELFARTIAESAFRPGGAGTALAQSSNLKTSDLNLVATLGTGVGDLVLSPGVDAPAPVTPSESLVWKFGSPALQTDKVVRIMTKISLGCMSAVMRSSVNDLQIVQTIVKPIAVYVMDMLGLGQSLSEVQFHDKSVDGDRAVIARIGRVRIPFAVVDASTASVDGDVVAYFDLSIVGDFEGHDDRRHIVIPPFVQVKQGCVLRHTAHVMNEAAEIADRELLTGDDRAVLVFAALCHDLGKATTTELRDKKGQMRWTAHGHEAAGGGSRRGVSGQHRDQAGHHQAGSSAGGESHGPLAVQAGESDAKSPAETCRQVSPCDDPGTALDH